MTIETTAPAISTAALTKHYGGGGLGRRGAVIPALNDVTLDVRAGEVFGFLGPNGAGKSTFIRLLLGFLHPTSGTARVLGRDIVTDSVAIRARTGYLPGGIAFHDGLTGERHPRRPRRSRRPALRPARALCDRLELDARTLRRPIRDYSRGMRQKLGIVQALQHDPELAILDEPSEGLDPLMQRAFYGILEDVRAGGTDRACSRRTCCPRSSASATGSPSCARAAWSRTRTSRRSSPGASAVVEVQFAGDPPDLSTVRGITAIVVDGTRLTCDLEGDPKPLLAAIATRAVTDLLIEPARLEDAFLELYAVHGDDAPATAAGGEAGQ